ncbi:MAG TPA: polymer-forming cytoskeletal protein [Flavobacteriaceae bacterium]|nr:cell shape determination protein CcmA [Flavobacteriaceae bacterium]HIB47491.1 polymer-forming cytoskeletal protein [Flavobacteriaceae bacterium]HIN98989.1 polymer-forming cytoskeletal protein [Flavobacteriaceae bacterium]|tara:strand:- start:1391 stop:1849 length:459 start_codon:yes stop_codon:yes gene_type:complete
MFSDKKDKQSMEPSASQNRINEGTELKGDIVSSGFFRIDGKVEGSISKPSKVVIGKTGTVNGKLICENADIEGTFNGDLDVTGTLTLKATAHIEGEVVVGKLAVEPGATFNASCSMQGAKKSTPSSDNQAAEDKTHPYDRKQRLKKASEPLK